MLPKVWLHWNGPNVKMCYFQLLFNVYSVTQASGNYCVLVLFLFTLYTNPTLSSVPQTHSKLCRGPVKCPTFKHMVWSEGLKNRKDIVYHFKSSPTQMFSSHSADPAHRSAKIWFKFLKVTEFDLQPSNRCDQVVFSTPAYVWPRKLVWEYSCVCPRRIQRLSFMTVIRPFL